MKKYLALALALILCFGLFACGTDEPAKTDAPAGKTDAPVQSADNPGTDAPGTDAPGTDAPGTDAPGTDAPGTDAPVTDAPTADTANVAIGTNYFFTLRDACANVKNGETIKILKDFTEEILFDDFDAMPAKAEFAELDAAYTIDGQNHTITANVDLESYIIVSACKLTIVNLNVVYTENSMTVENGKETCGVVKCESGTDAVLILDNCNFVSKYGDCIIVNDGDVTIKSGKYVIDPTENFAPQSNLICTHGGKLTVEDGTFERVGLLINRAMIRVNGKPDSITINGGTWRGSIGRLFYFNTAGNAPGAEDARTITVNGGIFEFGVDDTTDITGISFDDVFNFNNKGNTVVINGGEFTVKKGPDMFGFTSADTSITVKGGTFTINDATARMFVGGSGKENTTFVIEDGSFDSAAGKTLDENAAGYMSIKGGTFKVASDEASAVKALFAEGSTAKVN